MYIRHKFIKNIIALSAIYCMCQVNIGHTNPLLTRGSRVLLSSFSKAKKALSIKKVKHLTQLASQSNGTQLVKKSLKSLNLPTEVVEDGYLRIAIAQGKLTSSTAHNWFRSLRGTSGFSSTLSKVIGRSLSKTKGHLNEIKLAFQSKIRGIKVLSIGKKFKDPAKKSFTDIDLILEHNKKRFIIETKDYAAYTRLSMSQISTDLDTLKTYIKKHAKQTKSKLVPVFSMKNVPFNRRELIQLKKESKDRNIQLIFGNAKDQAEQIKLLGEIL